jgi:hypothetical protein
MYFSEFIIITFNFYYMDFIDFFNPPKIDYSKLIQISKTHLRKYYPIFQLT